MSDQPGQPPVQQGPVPPLPAQPYPPQAYPPQQGFAPPGAPPQPAKKRRAWIWIVLVVVLLLCCAGSAVAGLIGFGVKTAADQAAAVKKADAAYTKAVKGLQTAAESAAKVETPEASAKTTAALDAANVDLSTARAAITGLAGSDGRTAYLQGLDEAGKAVETLRAIAAESSNKARFLAIATEGISLYNNGHRHMNTAVDLSNKSQYRRASSEAGNARSFFKRARAKFAEADAMDKASDLEKSIAYVDLQLQKAEYARQMANYGNKGQISAYNRVVPKFNAINAKIVALKEPAALSDPSWATRLLVGMQARFTEELTKSGTLIDSAHKLLSGSGS